MDKVYTNVLGIKPPAPKVLQNPPKIRKRLCRLANARAIEKEREGHIARASLRRTAMNVPADATAPEELVDGAKRFLHDQDRRYNSKFARACAKRSIREGEKYKAFKKLAHAGVEH